MVLGCVDCVLALVCDCGEAWGGWRVSVKHCAMGLHVQWPGYWLVDGGRNLDRAECGRHAIIVKLARPRRESRVIEAHVVICRHRGATLTPTWPSQRICWGRRRRHKSHHYIEVVTLRCNNTSRAAPGKRRVWGGASLLDTQPCKGKGEMSSELLQRRNCLLH